MRHGLHTAIIVGAALLGSATAGGAVTYPWPNHLGDLTATYTFNTGTFAGQTAVLEASYELYELLADGAFIDDDFYYWSGGCPPVKASISFAGLTSSDPSHCSFVKFSDELLELDQAEFSFDPASNPSGVVALGAYGGAFVVYLDDSDIVCSDSPDCTTTVDWTIRPVPLPASALLLLGGMAGLGAFARFGRPSRG